MVAHACNLSTREAEEGGLPDADAHLVYILSSRLGRATECDPIESK